MSEGQGNAPTTTAHIGTLREFEDSLLFVLGLLDALPQSVFPKDGVLRRRFVDSALDTFDVLPEGNRRRAIEAGCARVARRIP